MARHEGDGRGVVPVGKRDPRIGGNGDGGRHAGNDLERDARLPEDLRLLAAAAEDEGVAALEAGHDVPPPGLLDEAPVDLLLGEGVVAPLLAGVDPTGLLSGMEKNLRADQMVVDDHIRLPDAFRPAEGDQTRIARSGADDIDFAFFHHRILIPQGSRLQSSSPPKRSSGADPVVCARLRR